MYRLQALGAIVAFLAVQTRVTAGPSPALQKRITAALVTAAQAQANGTEPDWTTLVNPFVGTDNDGYALFCPFRYSTLSH